MAMTRKYYLNDGRGSITLDRISGNGLYEIKVERGPYERWMQTISQEEAAQKLREFGARNSVLHIPLQVINSKSL